PCRPPCGRTTRRRHTAGRPDNASASSLLEFSQRLSQLRGGGRLRRHILKRLRVKTEPVRILQYVFSQSLECGDNRILLRPTGRSGRRILTPLALEVVEQRIVLMNETGVDVDEAVVLRLVYTEHLHVPDCRPLYGFLR